MLLGRRAVTRRPASSHPIDPPMSSLSLLTVHDACLAVRVSHRYYRPRTASLCNTCFLHAVNRVADHRLTCKPVLTYCLPSIILQSALTLDAVCSTPAISVRLCSASTWSHRRSFLFPYPATDDCGDRCWTTQYKMLIKKLIFLQLRINFQRRTI